MGAGRDHDAAERRQDRARTVIGSVDTSEFLVSLAASLGFVVNLGLLGIDLGVVAALLVGGLVAAPIAAWLVSRIPARIMGVAVGGLVILTNLKTLFEAGRLSGARAVVGFTLFAAIWVVLIAWTAWRHGRARRAQTSTRQSTELDETTEMEWSK